MTTEAPPPRGSAAGPCVFITTDASDVHADHVVNALAARGVRVLRFHPEDYPKDWRISLWPEPEGRSFWLESRWHSTHSDDVVAAWYRRPGPPSAPDGDPELKDFVRRQASATVFALYRVLEGRWLASPDALRAAEDKVGQLHRAARLGLPTPRTCVSNDPRRVRDFHASVGGKVVVKPNRVQGVFHDGVFRFPLTVRWDGVADDQAILASPTVYQEYVEKKLEIRAVVIGERVFAAEVPAVEGEVVDVRGPDDLVSAYTPHELPAAVAASLVSLTKSFGIRFCSADLVVTPRSEYVFLDLNPNGQWLWLDIESGLPLTEALVDELLSTGQGGRRA